MELTEQYSGYKNRRQKRMVQLKGINGFHLQNMLVTGVIIAKKVLVSNTTKTVINMRACGQLIKDTDKELTGEMKTKN